MKIILENEMERKAWDIILEAHYKWEKNHGDEIRNQMEWYFFDLYKEETDQMIAKETGKRLFEDYGPDGLDVIGVSEAMHISRGMLNNEDWLKDVTKTERQEFEKELVEEYQSFTEDFQWDKERIEEKVRDDLSNVYILPALQCPRESYGGIWRSNCSGGRPVHALEYWE